MTAITAAQRFLFKDPREMTTANWNGHEAFVAEVVATEVGLPCVLFHREVRQVNEFEWEMLWIFHTPADPFESAEVRA